MTTLNLSKFVKFGLISPVPSQALTLNIKLLINADEEQKKKLITGLEISQKITNESGGT